MCIHTLSVVQSFAHQQAALPLGAEQATLACHSVISQRAWLAEAYVGGRLLQLRRQPSGEPGRKPQPEWHVPDDDYSKIEYEIAGGGAEMCRIPRPGVFELPKRGKIRGFSRQSRMRLLCKLNMLASRELPPFAKFITLTYPRDLLPSWEWAKRQLNHVLMRMFRKWGDMPVLWRMEYQEDGSIHFHLLAFVKRFLPWWELADMWDTLIGNQVTPQESASTQVTAMKNWRQTSYYVSKYIAKDEEAAYWDLEHGRHWGVRFWGLLPVHKVVLALSVAEGYAVRRWIRRYRLARGVATRALGSALPFCHQSVAGITMFVPIADLVRIVRCLRGVTLRFDTGPPGVTATALPAIAGKPI